MIERIAELLREGPAVVLTGAGCSTESGIPDYRGPSSAQRVRKPIQYQEFIRSEEARRRYWSRSAVGWSRIADARPNAGHYALAQLEQRGAIAGVITQNVDGLHHAAGSTRIVELHGSLSQVRCLSCARTVTRSEFQSRILEMNGGWSERLHAEMLPDGDAELDAEAIASFQVPTCACGGVMKPDVVFFGENVPRQTVDAAWQLFQEGVALLVIGSSLTVYSGRRFVYRAQQEGKHVALINMGPTRADEIAAVKIDGRCGEVLPLLAAALV